MFWRQQKNNSMKWCLENKMWRKNLNQTSLKTIAVAKKRKLFHSSCQISPLNEWNAIDILVSLHKPDWPTPARKSLACMLDPSMQAACFGCYLDQKIWVNYHLWFCGCSWACVLSGTSHLACKSYPTNSAMWVLKIGASLLPDSFVQHFRTRNGKS